MVHLSQGVQLNEMNEYSPTETKMHIALNIPELQGAICETRVLRKSDLRSLCLVSRSWRSVAEPVLWGDLGSLDPLLRLLPQDARKQVRSNVLSL